MTTSSHGDTSKIVRARRSIDSRTDIEPEHLDYFRLTGDQLDVRPSVPDATRLGIGIIGSGAIVEHAHIPSYRNAGYRIAALASRTHEHAEALGQRTGIDRVLSIDALLNDPSVDIVDIAVPPDFQAGFALAAISAGKHVLAQKPLATSLEVALGMVAAAEEASVKLAVNQNARFDPAINAARQLIRYGVLGQRLLASMTMHVTMPWQRYYEDSRYDQLMLLHMSVHHIDQMRWLFGTPSAICATFRRVPDQVFHGETIAQYTLRYDDSFFINLLDDGANWASDYGLTYRIEGTKGVIKGDIGWPRSTYSTLSYKVRGPYSWITPEFSRMHFPDAFSATMGELMAAIEEGREPSNSGRDNLETMLTVFAGYRSSLEGRYVALSELDAAGELGV